MFLDFHFCVLFHVRVLALASKKKASSLLVFQYSRPLLLNAKQFKQVRMNVTKRHKLSNRVSQTLTEQCMRNVLSMYTLHSSHCMYISPPSHLPLPLLFFLETWIGERSPELEVTLVPWWLWAAPLVNTLSHVQLQWFAEQMDAGR